MNEFRFEELFRRYMYESLTDAEETELFQLWLNPLLEDRRKQVLDRFYDGLPDDRDMPTGDADLIFKQIISKKDTVHKLSHQGRRNIWPKLTAAASLLLLVGLAVYFVASDKKKPGRQETVQLIQPADIVAPEMNRATITLANGQKIYLDSVANGALTKQAGVKLVKLADGKIIYEATANTASAEMSFNTLQNPRGSKVIDIKLADGSQVWLNAGSSLTYPVAFSGNERNVLLEGEAYFEVTHDATKPFIVSKEHTAVKVLGTRFNVNAYDDETDIKITLLEGAIQVKNDQNVVAVKPGEQAIVKNDKINMAEQVNLEQVMSWKDGFFQMNGTDLASLMRQIARWYNVQVIYKNKMPAAKFGGAINRETSLSDMLKALEQYGIYSRWENGKIIVQ